MSDVARRIESTINASGNAHTRKAGWVPSITGFSGYGSVDKAHVLGRELKFQSGVLKILQDSCYPIM